MNLLDVISIIVTVGLTILAVFLLFGLVVDGSGLAWLERLGTLLDNKLKREP